MRITYRIASIHTATGYTCAPPVLRVLDEAYKSPHVITAVSIVGLSGKSAVPAFAARIAFKPLDSGIL
jgi:hypothetical protein